MAKGGAAIEPDFLSGGGKTAGLIRAFDWSKTSLGPIEGWPQSLKTATAILLGSPVPMVMLWGEDGHMIYNDAYSVFAGGRHPQLLGSKVREGWPEVADFNDNVMKVGLSGGTLQYKDQELTLHRHGRPEQVWMNLDYSPVLDESGRPAGVLAIVIETTERIAAERSLREGEERFRTVFDNAAVGMLEVDADWRILGANETFTRITGYTRDELIGQSSLAFTHPDDIAQSEEALQTVSKRGSKQTSFEKRYLRKDGGLVWIRSNLARISGEGRNARFLKIVEDVTARREAEAALRESEERFRSVFKNAAVGMLEIDADWRILGANDSFSEITGYRLEELIGKSSLAFTYGDDIQRSEQALQKVSTRGSDRISFEKRYVRKDGGIVWIRSNLARVGGEGRSARLLKVVEDITARRAAEIAQRELNETLEQRVAEAVAEREQAEEALRQAQKMEAVGQLTGGIAHDFNNLLTVITGNVDMARRALAAGETTRAGRAIDNAQKGAERAAALTQRLLAFSRRQPLDPRTINVDRLVTGMADLLHRALGETVQLETISNPGLWMVEADPNQLESAILNLAVNARDAMPEGGKLTIETANARLDEAYSAAHAEVAPGSYVVVAVTDTGHGMTKETVARVFDPFFTTKEVGKGTGLGLSMVYGFVKQSGGHVKIYSEEGQGTTVKIYLPRKMSGQEADELERDERIDTARSEQTILVVEDDDDVRAYTVEILRELGYRVLEAHDGPSALRLLERQGSSIDLLFTDVVMPAMSGRELADRAREQQPDLKILYTSGYTRNAVVHGGRLDPGVEMIAKPFTYHALARKVSDVLDSGKTGRVLLVEDDATVRMLAVEALEVAGYAVDEAANGSEALSRVRAAQGRYDAVILDVRLPEKKGAALAVELRAMHADLPILLAADEQVAELRKRFAEDKCVAVIAKPYNAARLQEALEALGVSCVRWS